MFVIIYIVSCLSTSLERLRTLSWKLEYREKLNKIALQIIFVRQTTADFHNLISTKVSAFPYQKINKSKMASVVTLPITLTATPAGYSKPSPSKASVPKQLPIYPAGPSFISAARRQILQRSFADDDKAILEARERDAEAKANASVDGTQYPGLGEEEESQTVLSSDPKEWKKQDHYAILGLGHLRYTATDDQIKVARK